MSQQNFVKRLYHQSQYRGIKELDILLGFFARNCLKNLSQDTLILYEQFLNLDEHTLYEWIVQGIPASSTFHDLVSLIRNAYEPS